MRLLLRTLLLALLVLAGLTLLFSEWGEVVVVRPEGAEASQETRVWIVDFEDGAYLRGSAGKGWTEAVVMAGSAALRRQGEWSNYRAFEVPGPIARDRVNAAMRAKYGFSDRFIGWTRDFSEARPVRLEGIP